MSGSTRSPWIEMVDIYTSLNERGSGSTRSPWIEIFLLGGVVCAGLSGSTRSPWIEIMRDLKKLFKDGGRAPHGARGLK